MILPNFLKKCMKLKELGEGVVARDMLPPPLDPPGNPLDLLLPVKGQFFMYFFSKNCKFSYYKSNYCMEFKYLEKS